MNILNDNSIVREMLIYFPWIEDEMVECTIDAFHKYEAIVTLTDGGKYLFDFIDKTMRKLPSSEQTMTKSETAHEFGKRLEKIMWRKGVSQTDLSRMTGVSQPKISNYVRGVSVPNFHVVDKIAKALGCSMDELRYI